MCVVLGALMTSQERKALFRSPLMLLDAWPLWTKPACGADV